MMDIKTLRQKMREQRNALGPAGQSIAAQGLDAQLRAFPVTANARHIGLYLVNDGEIDPARFMTWAFSQARHCYLPVLDTHQDRPMKFAEVSSGSRFEPNRFGIPEPIVNATGLLDGSALDVILLPLVAFDLKGNRIGMGGGFYDRTLEFTRQQPYDRRPKLIGLTHEFQYTDALKPSPWDIPLDGIATEKQAILFSLDPV
jgi:5-formyltetrahydrofolate cyclo-ligase